MKTLGHDWKYVPSKIKYSYKSEIFVVVNIKIASVWVITRVNRMGVPTFRKNLAYSFHRLCIEWGKSKKIVLVYSCLSRLQWPSGLRRRSSVAPLLGLRVRIPRRAWMSVFCVVCLRIGVSATGRSLGQKSPTYYGVTVCSTNLKNEAALASVGLLRQTKKNSPV